MQLRSFALLLAVPLVACSADDTTPTPDGPTVVPPTALARCADPARPVSRAWEVDNIRAPLIAQTQLGATIVVASGDGAVKTWTLDGAGTPSSPHYGTPFIEDGDVVPVLAAVPPGPTPAIAGLDGSGRTHLWSAAGAELRAPIQLVPAPGTFVAVDEQLRWLAGGTAAFGGALTVADLATGAIQGPLETAMWNITDAEIGHGGVLVTVGHMYGCPAIEVRDPRDPATVTAYWDGCLNGGQLTGWLRAVALNPYATEAIAVGDGFYMRFDLATVATGPVDLVMDPAARYEHVVWSFADQVALTLGPVGADSIVTVWSTADAAARRTAVVPAAIGLTVDPDAGLIITARADGMVRGDRCAE